MANEMRDRLRGLLLECGVNINTTKIADHLITNGVIIPSCKVGDAVYFICEDDEDDYFVSENNVNDVSLKGFFVSNYDPPQDDLGWFELYESIGKDAFFTKEEAEQKLKERRGGNDL